MKRRNMALLIPVAVLGCAVVEGPRSAQHIPGAHGPIAVVDTLFPDWDDSTASEYTMGEWFEERREIAIDRRVSSTMRPLVLRHEQCHAAISDARITLPVTVEELLCDAIAGGMR